MKKIILMLCIGGWGVAVHAHGVPDANVIELGSQTVIGERDGSLTVPGIQKAHDEIEKTPGGVALVESEEFENRYALTIKDMLKNTPGVYAQPRFGEEVRLSIRGSGVSRPNHLRGVTLLLDGVPINLPDDFGDFQELDPLTFRYVEVFKGANGLRYGSSTLGGAINFVTPTGRMAAQPNLLRLDGGSFDTYRLHGAMARQYDDWDFYVAGTESIGHGFRAQSQSHNQRLNTNVGYRIGDNAETRFYLAANHINQKIPGTVSLNAVLNQPQSVQATAQTFNTARDVDSQRLSNKTSFRLGGGQLDTGGYYFHKKLYHPITGIVVDQDGSFYGGFGRWTAPWVMAGFANELVVGANLSLGRNEAMTFVNNGGSRGVRNGDTVQKALKIDLYVEDRFSIAPQWTLIAGLQGVFSDRKFTNRLNAAKDGYARYHAVNPKLGVLWQVQPKAQVFANISRSYEPPGFGELTQTSVAVPTGFIPVDAQRGWTVEAGTRGEAGDVSWDVSVYHARLDKELLQFTVTPGIPAATFNSDKTIHEGAELGLEWTALRDAVSKGDRLVWQQAYTYSHFRFDGDAQFADKRLAGVPEHYYVAELRYQHPLGFFVAPGMEWVPQGGFVDFANTLQASGYAVLNVGAGVDLPHGLSLFLDARNLTDRRYVSSFSTLTNAAAPGANLNVFYPGDGRGFFGGLRWSF